MATAEANPELVKLKVDGKEISVPKGTNLIEAAKVAGVDVPYYCYHQDLSVAGNCRMCQLKVAGRPKLEIGCNTTVAEGMEVFTQEGSAEVQRAHEATLEFILINHPLDCTVCDQAGHCKLQDYHFEHNAKPSRFIEEKVHKPKAKPLGPTVILDAERCIMCTRCVRFCDEITGTSELGMINRGDRAEITVVPGRELDNPLAGCVVDLCPVGALTHREWRFNTRIWFTKQTASICPGCSTGCNVTVAQRDGEIVMVKGRYNAAVNKEWLCDEGRYGFDRFLPEERLLAPQIKGEGAEVSAAVSAMSKFKGKKVLTFLAPDLLLEDYSAVKKLSAAFGPESKRVLAYRERALNEVEKILVSPDYAANFRGAQFLGLIGGSPEAEYEEALNLLQRGQFEAVLFVGDRSVLERDLNAGFLAALDRLPLSAALLTDASSELAKRTQIVVPVRSILEKSGLLLNRSQRLQYFAAVVPAPRELSAEWDLYGRLAKGWGLKLPESGGDREATLALLGEEPRLQGLRIADIKDGGVCLKGYCPAGVDSAA